MPYLFLALLWLSTMISWFLFRLLISVVGFVLQAGISFAFGLRRLVRS